ncbi:MAG: hypothetical protein ACKO96_22115 [Flammeovirgaceae bacterium]
MRNTIFNIRASSIRKMIPIRYENNMIALQKILKVCNDKKIQVLVYIPPIRSDVRLPYELAVYNKFKLQVRQMTSGNSLFFFKDFEKNYSRPFMGS